jgi:hypothetical protein
MFVLLMYLSYVKKNTMTNLSTDSLVDVMCIHFTHLKKSDFTFQSTRHEGNAQSTAVLPYSVVKSYISDKIENTFVTEIHMHGYWTGPIQGPQWGQYPTALGAKVWLLDNDANTVNAFNPVSKVDMLHKLSYMIPRATPSAIPPSPTHMNRLDWVNTLERLVELIRNNKL